MRDGVSMRDGKLEDGVYIQDGIREASLVHHLGRKEIEEFLATGRDMGEAMRTAKGAVASR